MLQQKMRSFSKHLFWDTDRSKLNFDKDCSIIIKQVLEYGLIEDWRIIKDYYGIEKITEVSMTYRELDSKAATFVASLSNVPIEKFKCFTYQQSIPKHWNF